MPTPGQQQSQQQPPQAPDHGTPCACVICVARREDIARRNLEIADSYRGISVPPRR